MYCGENRETVEHVLLECNKERFIREELMKELEKIWMEGKGENDLQLNLKVILNPWDNKKLSEDSSRSIMHFVFSFIKRMSRNL